MDTLGYRIRTARRDKRWSQAQLALACGWESASRVGNYEQGTREPTLDDVRTIAKALGVQHGWLATGEGERAIASPLQPDDLAQDQAIGDVRIVRSVPLISSATAGNWGEVCDSYQPGDGERPVPTTAKVGRRAFALRVKGDSMEPRIPDGAIVIVDPAAEAMPGKMVVVRQNHDAEATVKTLISDGGQLLLKPENARYPIMQLRDDAVICGVVRQIVMDVD